MSKTKKHKTKHTRKRNRTHKITKSRTTTVQLCKPHEPFERKAEALFKKNGLDIVSVGYNLEKQVVNDLNKAIKTTTIKPNEDFYSYINSRWINKTELDVNQKYIVQIDNFRLTQDKVYMELVGLIKKYLHTPGWTNHKTSLQNAFKSFHSLNSNVQTSKLAMKYISDIRPFFTEGEPGLWKLLGYINRNEVVSWGAPFVWTINPDDKRPSVYKCFLEPFQPTLLDVDVYYNDQSDTPKSREYKHNYLRQYKKYLHRLFKNTFGEKMVASLELKPEHVIQCETDLLNATFGNTVKATSDSIYNVISSKEAIEQFGFDWQSFCVSLGFKHNKVPNEFITSNVNYMLCGTQLLKKQWATPMWRTYWIYIYIRQIARWNERGRTNFYEFSGMFMRGQRGEIDKERLALFSMSFLFNEFLTKQYVAQYRNEKAIEYVRSLAIDLKEVFKRIIKRINWMEPKTKEKALLKLEKMKLIVGTPERLKKDPLLKYDSTNAWGNIEKMAHWRCREAIMIINRRYANKNDCPTIDWAETPPKFISTQAYVVNAMYTPTQNAIYIPLGYIQKPFIDLEERGIEYNLAHIGFTIAHEMSHALDDWGSDYDETGALNNWWTEKDRMQFKTIQTDVVKQYEVMAKRDGITFDAWPSIGEDIADIAGFGICQEYLRDFQMKNQDILPIVSLSFNAFYTYFAFQSRQKISKAALIAQLKTNPHPLDKYRCNVPLTRSRIFRAIYNVQPENNMWWHNLSNIWSN